MSNLTEYNKRHHAENVENIRAKLEANGFEYLGMTRPDKECQTLIRCKKCKGEFVRVVRWFSFSCPVCKELELKAKREPKRKAKVEREKILEKKRKEKAQEEYIKLYRKQVCKECGKTYTLAEYRIREHTNHCQFTAYCSSECRERSYRQALREWNKERKYKARHKVRAIKYGCEYENGVTLKRLIKRDGLRCAICGGMCDLNDRSYGNGNGPLYPSIDHIKPMSKQGGHTWDNVQIAHIICNARKSAKTEEKYGNAL